MGKMIEQCPYFKKSCELEYNAEKCYEHFRDCHEFGRLKFLEKKKGNIAYRGRVRYEP